MSRVMRVAAWLILLLTSLIPETIGSTEVAMTDGSQDCASSPGSCTAVCTDCLITIIAYNRPDYLAEVLRSLDVQPTISMYSVLFFVDPTPDGDSAVFTLASNWAETHRSRGGTASVVMNDKRLGCHSNKAQAVRAGFSKSGFVILVEDDTPLASDALAFLEWAKFMYASDTQVFTVSAYGDSGHGADETVPAEFHFAAGRRSHYTPWVWGMWRDRYESAVRDHWHGRDAEMNFKFTGIRPDPQAEDVTQVLVDIRAGRHSGLRGTRFEVFPILSRSNNIGVLNSSHAHFGWDAKALKSTQFMHQWGDTANRDSPDGASAFRELNQFEIPRACESPFFRFGKDTDREVCSKLCQISFATKLGASDLIELDWVRNSMLSRSPCVVRSTAHLGKGVRHVILALTRVSQILELVNGRFTLPKRMVAAVQQMRADGVILGAVHFSDEGCWDDTSWYKHFDYVFRNYVCPLADGLSLDGVSSKPFVRWFPLGPTKLFEEALTIQDGTTRVPASQRRYLCNFLGQARDPLLTDRKIMLSVLPKVSYDSQDDTEPTYSPSWTSDTASWSCVVRTTQSFTGMDPPMGPESYVSALSGSAFTLCPKGKNEETFRLWEALEVGSVPIIKNSSHWAPLGVHPLPVISTWEEIRTLLDTFAADPPAVNELQTNVVAWYRSFKKRNMDEFGTAISRAEVVARMRL